MGKLELVIPGDVVELVEGMQDLYIMGTVDGFQKVTKIDGLEDMSALTVSFIFLCSFVAFKLWPPFPPLSFCLSISPLPVCPLTTAFWLPRPISVDPRHCDVCRTFNFVAVPVVAQFTRACCVLCLVLRCVGIFALVLAISNPYHACNLYSILLRK